MPRFGLSATQLVATALAAITATIAASYLGVTGTVIGAAVASVVSAVGNAVYGHSLRSTQARVRPGTASASAEKPTGEPRVDRRRRHPWRGIAIGSVAAFVAVLAVITGVEIVAGRPISDLVRGDSGSGTSVFGNAAGSDAGTGNGATPTVTTTVTPSVVVTTPTVTQTAPAVTRTATPTVTETPPSTPTPSESATPSAASSQPSTQSAQLG